MAITHPEEDNSLSNKHTDSAGSHTESDTNENRNEGNLNGDPKNVSHTAKEALIVPVVVMVWVRATILRFGVVVGREFHCAVRAAVRNTSGTMLAFVMALVVMVLMSHHTHNAVEALNAETFDLVGGGFGGGFDFADTAKELGHDTTHDITALSVWGIGGRSNVGDRVEGNLLKRNVSLRRPGQRIHFRRRNVLCQLNL